MQGVAVPQMTPEIAVATVARFAQDRNDPQLTALTADLASAYGRGPMALQGPVAALNQYAYDNYHWGDRALSVQLLRPVAALNEAAGLDPGKHLDTRPPDQRSQRSQPAAAAAGPPRPQPSRSADPHTVTMVRQMAGARDSRQRDMDALYADPNYARQLAGESDDSLDEDYLRRRRTLFGKALQ